MARTVRYLVSLTPPEIVAKFQTLCETEPELALAVSTEPGGFRLHRTWASPPTADYDLAPLILRVRLAPHRRSTLVTARTVSNPDWPSLAYAIGTTVLFFGANLVLDAIHTGPRRRRDRSELLNLVARLLAPHEITEATGPYRDVRGPA